MPIQRFRQTPVHLDTLAVSRDSATACLSDSKAVRPLPHRSGRGLTKRRDDIGSPPLAERSKPGWGYHVGRLGSAVEVEPADLSISSGRVAVSIERKVAWSPAASQGIGAGIVKAFVERGFDRRGDFTEGYRSPPRWRLPTASPWWTATSAQPATAARVVEAARPASGRSDVVVNNAGIFLNRPFTDYTAAPGRSIDEPRGFLYLHRLAVKQMLARPQGIVRYGGARPQPDPGVTAAGADDPARAAWKRHAPAMRYAKDGIRVNAVAASSRRRFPSRTPRRSDGEPVAWVGVDGPGHHGRVQYLTDAVTVTGQTLYVDVRARWPLVV